MWPKGLKHSVESRKKMSEAAKGKGNSNYGKAPSAETRKKISAAMTGRKLTAEHALNVSKALKGKYTGADHPGYGKHPTEETKKKIRESNKGQKRSEETKKNISASLLGNQNAKGTHDITGYVVSDETCAKISASLLGREVSEKTREKISKSRKGKTVGDKHPNWQGGLSFEPYSPKFNSALKDFIRERDGYTCQLCGKTQREAGEKLSVHHIDYDKKNSKVDNLIALCRSCNSVVNTDRESWTAYFNESVPND